MSEEQEITPVEETPEAPPVDVKPDVVPDDAEPDETPPADPVEEETVVTFGDDAPDEDKEDTGWVTNLRKTNREQAGRIRELEKQTAPEAVAEQQLGPQPTLEDADYDETVYTGKMEQWLGHRAELVYQQRIAQDDQARQDQNWKNRLGEFEAERATIVNDAYEAAEDAVKVSLNEVQQGILIQVLGGKLAPLISGLGRNAAELKNLAGITDNIMFAAAAGKLEAKMKITKRTPATLPEGRVIGNASGGATHSDTLEALREKAEESGDYTDILKYKRKMAKA